MLTKNLLLLKSSQMFLQNIKGDLLKFSTPYTLVTLDRARGTEHTFQRPAHNSIHRIARNSYTR
jgi:hypothetical protein